MVITWNELRDARERLNLTQEELAEKLGVSTRTITNWERAGVARKAEYKVERFFGENLVRDEAADTLEREVAHLKAVENMSIDERADHEGWGFSRVLREASDAELLEELTRRARKRGLIAVSKEMNLPREIQREAGQILRGERSRLTRDDINVGGFGKNVDPHTIDTSKLALAASHDQSGMKDQVQPDYENESQDPEDGK